MIALQVYCASLGLLFLSSSVLSDGSLRYFPPFTVNAKFLISQAFGGSSTHRDVINFYAVDLVMPLGEPVCAAQNGVVTAIYDGKGLLFNDTRNSNYVNIHHANGQLSNYEHLLPGSINVKVGQKIERHQCFAQVGATGNATGPHLHFAVLEERKGELVSVPFKFVDPSGRAYTPEYLQWVRN